MANFSDTSRPHGLDDLPHYLIVKFDPSDLPPGTVDFQDLSQLVRGLEDILMGMLITDLEEEGRDPEQLKDFVKAFRVTAFTPAPSSYKVIITLAPILDFMMKKVGKGVTEPLDPQELRKQFATTVSDTNTTVSDQEADLYNSSREQIAHLVSFLRDLRASHLEPISKYIGSRAKTGVSRVGKVIERPGNLARPITVATELEADEGDKSIPLDDDFAKGAKRFEAQPERGPQADAVGHIISWSGKNPRHFRLRVAKFKRTIECRYNQTLDPTVRSLIKSGQVVAVRGTTFYPAGLSRIPPPLYVQVHAIHEAQLVIGPTYVESTPPPVSIGAPRSGVQGSLWDDSN